MDRRTKILTLGAVCLGLFMLMLDTTVVNLALPTIERKLGSGLAGLQWIVDAFTLVLACLMLTGGTLGDLYGRKRAYLGGLLLFTTGSLMCAFAPSVGVLIGARSLQGVGAAIMMPVTLAILTNAFTEPKERAQAIGIWAGVSGIALALGPAVGGAMVDSLGWQSIFFMNVPVGLIALVLTWRVVKESKDPEGRSLDVPGQFLAVLGLGSLTYALIEASTYGWSSSRIVTFLIVAVLALGGFALLERRSARPMLDLSFFRNSTVSGANGVGMLVSFGLFGIFFLFALFMQNVQGFSPAGAGVRQLAATLALVVASIASGPITGRLGARLPMTIGMLLSAAGVFLFATVQATTGYHSYWWMLVVLGLGVGLVLSPVTTALMSTVPTSRAGMAAATSSTTRQVGGVFGIALLGSIVTSRFAGALTNSLTALHVPAATTAKIVAMAQQGGQSSGQTGVNGLDTALLHRLIDDSFTSGLHLGLWVCGCLMVAGAILAAVAVRGTSPHAQLARKARAGAPRA
jgi:EmrB/QacA subfamily drug resistance transporter